MRQRRIQLAAGVAVVAIVSVVATTAFAGGGNDIREELEGFQEVPAVSTVAEGKFEARIRDDEISYELSYEDLEGTVTQAHIHLGQRAVNGGISVWLCDTETNPAPVETPDCEPSPGEVEGVITEAQVVGPDGQGIVAGEFDELVRAIRSGVTYANVHSSMFTGGEVRGQLEGDRD
jgi:CHRD domain